MPNGFVGNAARRYLGDVDAAQKRALTASRNSTSGQRPVREARFPFSAEDADIGRPMPSRGDSNNIVVNQADYEDVARTICKIDENIGERLYHTACEIDEMCQTIFMMPHVSPGCLNVSGGVKGCLGILRDITEDAALEMRRFAREITEIGG